MKWTPWLLGSLTAAVVIGCGGDRRNTDTGATSGAETESGTMQGGAGTAADTAAIDSAKANQTKSGVTDTRSGESTLGEGVTETRPDQGQPVTSKGDTLREGGDTAGKNQ
jgi:hypothetical protein